MARGFRVARVETIVESLGGAHRVQQKADEHQELLRRISFIQDVQAAWLLLLCRATPRANCPVAHSEAVKRPTEPVGQIDWRW